MANSIFPGAPARTETSQTTVPESVAPVAGDLVAIASCSLVVPVLVREGEVEVEVVVVVVLLPSSFLAGPMPSAAKAVEAKRPVSPRARRRTVAIWRRGFIAPLSSTHPQPTPVALAVVDVYALG